MAWVSAELKIDPASIDPHRSFFDYGVDSVTTVMLVVALEE
ncbi:MAG: acyl carrier protein [Gammaproteobacteria bacterium]